MLAHKAELDWAAQPDPAKTRLQKLWDYRWLAVIALLTVQVLFVAGSVIGWVVLVVLIGLAVGLLAAKA